MRTRFLDEIGPEGIPIEIETLVEARRETERIGVIEKKPLGVRGQEMLKVLTLPVKRILSNIANSSLPNVNLARESQINR